MAVVNIVHHMQEELRLLNFEEGELEQKALRSWRGVTKDVIHCDGGGGDNIIIMFSLFLFGSISICVNSSLFASKVKIEYGTYCN